MSNLVRFVLCITSLPTMYNLVTFLTMIFTEIASSFTDDITFILAYLAVNGPVLGHLGIMSYLVCCQDHDVQSGMIK